MQYIRICDWEKFQHYKKRNPPWVKLYAAILDDDDFDCLPDDSKLLFFCLLPFASRRNNKMRLDLEWLQKKLPISLPITLEIIQPLVNAKFIICYQDDSEVIADSLQDAMPEQRQSRDRAETEREGEKINPTLQECIDTGIILGISEQQSTLFYEHYQPQSWLWGNGQPITELQGGMVRWRNNQYKFEKRGAQQPVKEESEPLQPATCAICHKPAKTYRQSKARERIDLCSECDKAAKEMGSQINKLISISELERKVEQGKAKIAERSPPEKDSELVMKDKAQVARQKLMQNFGK